MQKIIRPPQDLAAPLSTLRLEKDGTLANQEEALKAVLRVMALLVANNTDSSMEMEKLQPTLPLMQTIAEAFRKLGKEQKRTLHEAGIAIELVEEPKPKNGSPEFAGQGSLVIRIGPAAQGGIAFVSHLDTAQVEDPAAWRTDPRQLTEIDGKLYARGAVDMKGMAANSIAAAALALPYARHMVKPLYLGFTWGEETSHVGGVPALEKALKQLHASPDVAVVPESEGKDKLILAHRGYTTAVLTFKGSDALTKAAEMISYIEETQARIPSDPILAATLYEEHFDPHHPKMNAAKLVVEQTGGHSLHQARMHINFRAGNEQHEAVMRELLRSKVEEMNARPPVDAYRTRISAPSGWPEKGLRIHCHGISGHSSDPANGYNAAYIMARMITFSKTLQEEYSTQGLRIETSKAHCNSEDNIIPSHAEVAFRITSSDAALCETAAARLREEAAKVGNIAKQSALTLAAQKTHDGEFLAAAEKVGVSVSDSAPMQTPSFAGASKVAIKYPIHASAMPWQGDSDSPYLPRLISTLRGVIGESLQPAAETGAADAGPVLQVLKRLRTHSKLKAPEPITVEWGPGSADDGRAHGDNEYISREDMRTGLLGMLALTKEFTGLDEHFRHRGTHRSPHPRPAIAR